MNAITPYLNFDGNTREAMTFYQKVLGGDLKLQTFKEVGMGGGDPKVENRIVHGMLHAGGTAILMASDTQPGQPFKQGNNVYVCVDCSTKELDTFFKGLVAGGKAEMEPQDTFWGARFAMLTDKFGVNWMFNAQLPKA